MTMDQVDCCTLPTIFLVLLMKTSYNIYIALVSQARPFCSAAPITFSMQHVEEGSGELHVGPPVWNATIELVTCKAHNCS